MKGNMYEVNLAETWELFGAYAQGSKQALVCVLSHAPLTAEAQHALNSSAERLGYGKAACTFLSLQAMDYENDAANSQSVRIELSATPIQPSEFSAPPLDAQALFMAIEGFDPTCLVIADAQTARLVQEAYRCEVRTQAANHIFGRTTVAFVDFSRMLNNAQDKQYAWALLKRLPHFGEI